MIKTHYATNSSANLHRPKSLQICMGITPLVALSAFAKEPVLVIEKPCVPLRPLWFNIFYLNRRGRRGGKILLQGQALKLWRTAPTLATAQQLNTAASHHKIKPFSSPSLNGTHGLHTPPNRNLFRPGCWKAFRARSFGVFAVSVS
jgi:hypothetical protein